MYREKGNDGESDREKGEGIGREMEERWWREGIGRDMEERWWREIKKRGGRWRCMGWEMGAGRWRDTGR